MPTRHVEPTQQPVQLVALQAGVGDSHEPPVRPPLVWHCCFVVEQSVHCAPPLPHACVCPPVRQTSPSQQPAHVSGLQVAPFTHWRVVVSHVSPWFTHCVQAFPPKPQALGSRPVRHCATPFTVSQQPPQFAGLQPPGVSFTQRLVAVSQRSNPCALQSEHVLPKPPQTASVAPSWQTSPAQQPVGQLVAVHEPPPSVALSARASGVIPPSGRTELSTLASAPVTGKSSSMPERPQPPATRATSSEQAIARAKAGPEGERGAASKRARSVTAKLQARPRAELKIEPATTSDNDVEPGVPAQENLGARPAMRRR